MTIWLILMVLVNIVIAVPVWLHLSGGRTERWGMQRLEQADAAMVFGCPVYSKGKPSRNLKARVEAGVHLYQAGLVPVLLMSGGTGADGANEAEAMRDMAVEMGVPEEAVLLESQSDNTYANLQLSAPCLEGWKSIILVSSAYHLPRVHWMAQMQYPDKQFSVYAEKQAFWRGAEYFPALIKETLSWVKALWVEYVRRPKEKPAV